MTAIHKCYYGSAGLPLNSDPLPATPRRGVAEVIAQAGRFAARLALISGRRFRPDRRRRAIPSCPAPTAVPTGVRQTRSIACFRQYLATKRWIPWAFATRRACVVGQFLFRADVHRAPRQQPPRRRRGSCTRHNWRHRAACRPQTRRRVCSSESSVSGVAQACRCAGCDVKNRR